MNFINDTLAIAYKDLILEFRTKETLASMALFSITILLIINFAISVSSMDVRVIGGGVIWIAIIFSGAITMNRSFARETQDGALQALLIAPISRSSIFFGKLLSGWICMMTSLALIIPIFIVLFNLNLMEMFFYQLAVFGLGTLGFVTVNSIISATFATLNAKDILAPLIMLPLLVPLIISATKISTGLLMLIPVDQLAIWYKTLILFNILYLVVGWLLFELILSE
ncbi:MAG: heme exporter protein CcmB [Nitrospinota bacterium]